MPQFLGVARGPTFGALKREKSDLTSFTLHWGSGDDGDWERRVDKGQYRCKG